MKKHGILNSAISKVLSDMGHTDKIVIADCGLPIPEGVEKIDLAYEIGKPAFLEILDVLIREMQVEKVILAEEIKSKNEGQYYNIMNKLESTVDCEFVSHEEFKAKTSNVKVIIRTGEATPYSNIILQSGVIF